MATIKAPITPSVLAWALAEDGRSDVEIADAGKFETAELRAWVQGLDSPTTGQVSDLAKTLRRPRALFFLPRPPVQATLPTSFRHPPGDAREISPETRRHVRRARRVQHAMVWALRDKPRLDVPRVDASASTESAAETARTWLGLSTGHPIWRDDRDALRWWRSRLDERGVLVYALPLGQDSVRGFSAWNEVAPLIVSNISSVSPAARIFTISHEFGHLLRRQDATCLEAASGLRAQGAERWCERFAGALLMPQGEIEELAAGWFGEVSIDHVRQVAARFRVSHRAAALRLVYLDLADRSLYGSVEAVFRPITSASGGGGSEARPDLRLRQYGERTVRTVLRELPRLDALSVLRLDALDVREIASKVSDVIPE